MPTEARHEPVRVLNVVLAKPRNWITVDVWDLTKLLARRWYLALPFLVATGAATLFLANTIQPDYKLISHVILTPAPALDGSDEAKATAATNPWTTLGASALAQSGKLSIGGEAVVEDLATRGLSDSYTVTIDNWTPIITIEVVGHTPAQAMATTDTLVSMFQTNIKELQKSQGAADAALMGVRRLPGDTLEASTSNVKRAVIAVGAAGLLLSCGLTVALDVWIRRRGAGRRSGYRSGFVPGELALTGGDPSLRGLTDQEVLALPVPPPIVREAGQSVPPPRTGVTVRPPDEDVTSTVILPLSLGRGTPRS